LIQNDRELWAYSFSERRHTPHRPAQQASKKKANMGDDTPAAAAPASSSLPETPVTLNLYDLTKGMARALSPMLLGKSVEGIWHSGADGQKRRIAFCCTRAALLRIHATNFCLPSPPFKKPPLQYTTTSKPNRPRRPRPRVLFRVWR
jgi:hypothetical protein